MKIGKDSPEDTEGLTGEMGPERIALGVSKLKAALLLLFSFGCLSVAFVNFVGWIPYAPGLTLLMTATAYTGLVLAVVEIREFRSDGRANF